MPAKKIVFPTDFSKCSEAALEYATILARALDATLFIIHAEEPDATYGGEEMYYGLLEPDYAELQRMLEEIKPTDSSIAYEHHLVRGRQVPAKQIVRFAKKEGADLIVIGTQGRTGLKRLLMGSTAKAVIRGAPCPVLIVKQSDDARLSKSKKRGDAVLAVT